MNQELNNYMNQFQKKDSRKKNNLIFGIILALILVVVGILIGIKVFLTGNVAEEKINGGWKNIETDNYWVFKKNEFWWYKSSDDLSDNYWYGTVDVLKGKSGLEFAGLSGSKVDSIINQSDGKVTESDIYTLVLTPKKIISGGVDKSDVNIPDGTTWTYIWIVVDNEEDGIYGQVLNMQSYETSYYEKKLD